jgi:hypothetical protein
MIILIEQVVSFLLDNSPQLATWEYPFGFDTLNVAAGSFIAKFIPHLP